MKLKRPRRPEVVIDMTNLVDVVLLLLIFFMVSSSATESARLGIELPRAGHAEPAPEREPLVVGVDEHGGYTINGRAVAGQDPQALRTALAAALKTSATLPPLVLIGDAKAPHQAVVTVMDVARGLGVGALRIATRPQQPAGG